jgi:superfamily II DNA or RNA helicase
VEDTRQYRTQFEFETVDENTYQHKRWPKGHPRAGEPIVLRDYQPEIINRFLANPQCVQEVATGAGKTIVTAALADAVSQYGRTIIIVPNKSLVTQTEDDFVNLELDTGVYFGDRKEYGRTHTICTWQSLNNLLKTTKNAEAEITIGEFLEGVVAVIVDETHQAKADALKTLLSGPFAQVPIRWGLTGTIPKEDYARQSINCMLGPVVGQLSASELQEAGHLAQCHVNVVQLADHREYANYQSELKYLIETAERLDYIARLISTIVDSGNTLILVDRISAGRALAERLPGSVFVSGATKAGERKEHYDEVAEASDKIIIATYGVAAVGINIPRIFNLVLLEPGKSFVRVIQSIGRGIRRAEDKDFVQIWDITSTCKFAKRHLTKRKAFYKEANYPFTVEKAEWE